MVRLVIVGIVVAVAFTLYALVDAAMTDGARARGVSKPVWVVLVVLLPVIGGVLWFMLGKGSTPAPKVVAPDDDPRFAGTRMSQRDLDAHMRDLEEQLKALDDEVYPGEVAPGEPGAGQRGAEQPGSEQSGSEQPGAEQPGSGGPASPGPQPPKPHSPKPPAQ